MSEQFPATDFNHVINAQQGALITERAQLEQFVEPAALPTCQLLYDRNVRTVSASANTVSSPDAYVDVEFASLSPENQQIALSLGEPIWHNPSQGRLESPPAPDGVHIKTPIEAGDTEQSITEKLYTLAQHLQPQELTWGRYSFDELKQVYGYEPDEPVDPADFASEGYHYNPDTGYFYASEELYQKSQAVPGSDASQ